MCEFVSNHVDMKKMTAAQKKKLKSDLSNRKKVLQKKIDALDKMLKKIK